MNTQLGNSLKFCSTNKELQHAPQEAHDVSVFYNLFGPTFWGLFRWEELQKNQFVNDSATCFAMCLDQYDKTPFFFFFFTSKYSVFVFLFFFLSLSLFVAARLQQFWVWIFWIGIFMLLLLLISEEEKPVVFRLVGVCCFCNKIFWNLAPSISGLGARFCFSRLWVSRVREEERERERGGCKFLEQILSSWVPFFLFSWGGERLNFMHLMIM